MSPRRLPDEAAMPPANDGTAQIVASLEAACRDLGASLGLTVDCAQSNSEGDLVGSIQDARDRFAGIVINAGAYTHTSIAIFDALNLYDGIVVEVHISNIHKRETFRHHSYISGQADSVIVGCGTHGYLLALRQIAHRLG